MTELTKIAGIGPKMKQNYEKLGVGSAEELLLLFPRAYEDRSRIYGIDELPLGENGTFVATVADDLTKRWAPGRLLIHTCTLFDDTGSIKCTFFNNKYLDSYLKVGHTYLFYGKAEGSLFSKKIVSPTFAEKKEGEEVSGSIVPVYPLTAGISQNSIRRHVAAALKTCLPGIAETLPEWLRQEEGLLGIAEALREIHSPTGFDTLDRAKRRLCYEELFYIQLRLLWLKSRRKEQPGIPMERETDMGPFFAALPFAPTGAQRRVIGEILSDLKSGQPMNRLVQGDVGSGKTAVAAAATYFCFQNGFQSVLMAPTEILAEQHFRSLKPLLSALGMRAGLLTAALPAKKKRELKERIAQGEVDFVIGTHAVIQKDVEFFRLGLCVADEQHRFGVGQRAALADKAETPNLLIMSATPIPRSLSLVLYGDLDISSIDELPPGRQKVDTFVVNEGYRQRVNAFLKKQADEGRQAYVICPFVEQSETPGFSEVAAATDYFEKLKRAIFPVRVGLVHGKLKAQEKDGVMRGFERGEIAVLVATTVVEVGVNVPNATLMVIEDADRFGLSQLHQLRGRVGRGADKSYCILFCQSGSETARMRLDVLKKTNDGFEIAREDLKMRRAGDLFGSRQSGAPTMRIADAFGDLQLLEQTRRRVEQLLTGDPKLRRKENEIVRRQLRQYFADRQNKNKFN